MRKNIFVLIAVLAFGLSFASAGILEINVDTVQNHVLNINFLNPERSSGDGPISYGSVTRDTGNGKLSFTFSDTAPAYDVDVFLMKGKNVLIHETFENVQNNQKILLTLVPGVIATLQENYDPYAQTAANTNDENQNNTGEVLNLNEGSQNNSSEQNSTESPQNQEQSNSNDIQSIETKQESSFFESPYIPFMIGSMIILIVFVALAFIYKILFKQLKSQLEKEIDQKVAVADPLTDLENKLKDALKDIAALKKERARHKSIQYNLRKDIEEKKKIIKEIKSAKRKLLEDKKKLDNLRGKLRDNKNLD